MKKIYVTILILLTSYSTQAQDDPDLLGTWYLHYVESNGTIMHPPSEDDDGFNIPTPSIIISSLVADPIETNLTGTSTCNEFFLHYELPSSGNLNVTFFNQTLVLCDTDTFEPVHLGILSANATNFFSYTIDLTNETLTMIDLLGEKLVYGRQVLSIEDNEAFSNSIKVYPNPVQKELSIKGISTNTTPTYSIYNLVGNVIVSKRSLTQASLDVNTLKTGIYFVKITQQGKTAVKKFVKI
jgi:hypothetical protein